MTPIETIHLIFERDFHADSTLHQLALLSMVWQLNNMRQTQNHDSVKLQEALSSLPLQPDADLNELNKFVAQLLADLTR